MTEENGYIEAADLKALIQPEASKHITFIFGAGASHGYSVENSFAPPIVSQLFDASNQVVAEVIADEKHEVIRNSRRSFAREIQNHGGDLEAYLSSLYQRDKEDNIFSNLVLYLRDLFYEVSNRFAVEPNNYIDLFDIMRSRRGGQNWSCISFNYDTLMEKSYMATGRDPNQRDFSTVKQYIDLKPVMLKMHGGVNHYFRSIKPWTSTDSSRVPSGHSLFSKMMTPNGEMTGIAVENPANPIKPPYENRPHLDSNGKPFDASYYNFPLIMVPLHAEPKPENIFFENMLSFAKKQLEDSDLIISIGYNFGDRTFLQLFKELDSGSKTIILVGTKASTSDLGTFSPYQTLKSVWNKNKVRVLNADGFSGLISAVS